MLDLSTRGDFARHRRLRQSAGLRRLVAETRLSAADFVYPLFVTHGAGMREEIESMPGQFRISLDQIAHEADDLKTLYWEGYLGAKPQAGGDEIARWFWGETALGQLLRRVRDRLDAAGDPASKAAAFGVCR